MNLYVALQNSDFVDKTSRTLEALEIRGHKNYLDLELTLNSMKNLPLLKIFYFTTEICFVLKIAEDPEMVLNDSVQELWSVIASGYPDYPKSGFIRTISETEIRSPITG